MHGNARMRSQGRRFAARVTLHPARASKSHATGFRALAEPIAEFAAKPEAPQKEVDVVDTDSTAEAPSVPSASTSNGADAAEDPANADSAANAEEAVAAFVSNISVKDTVWGTVLWSNERGARIAIDGLPEIAGFMPKNRGPFAIRSALDKNPFVTGEFGKEGCIPKGLKRPYQVIAIPNDMGKNGKGPLLAANNLDLAILWKRVQQILEQCTKQCETVRVEVHGVVERGLLVTLLGLRGFIPVSHVPKEPGEWLDADMLRERYAGKEVEVSLMTVTPGEHSFTASITNATRNRALRKLTIGSLVWGTVRTVKSWGVFIGLDDMSESALLHVTNMSWSHVPDVYELFEEGDRVRAVVIGLDDDFTRISVSTRDLEAAEGDMLRDKELVYRDADENVKRFLEHVAQWEDEQARA